MAFFGLKLGLDLEMRAALPHQKFQGVPPPPGSSAKAVSSSLDLLESLEVFADRGETRNECPSSSSSYPAIKFRCV